MTTLYKQMQQVHMRKKAARKEAIKNGFMHMKDTLAKLQPSHATLTWMGIYVVITNLLAYFIASITDHSCWLIPQLLVGACFLGYSTFLSKKITPIPGWMVALFWLIGLSFCLPINVLWHWWHKTTLLLNLGLFLAHLVVTLFVLPLYLGLTVLTVTLCIAIYLSIFYPTQPLVLVLSPLAVAWLLLLWLGLGLLIFAIFINLKVKMHTSFQQVDYLKDREKMRTAQKLKEALYDAAMVPFTSCSAPKGYGSILGKAVRKMEESISFLDSNMPLYKQDFQSIINKLYGWVAYFNKREKAKDHALLKLTKISLDKLIDQVEFVLCQEVDDPPTMFVEQIKGRNSAPFSYIICDIHQVIYSLVQAVLRVSGKLDGVSAPMVGIQLHATALQFKQSDPIGDGHPTSMLFQAIGLVIRNGAITSDILPKVKPLYDDRMGVMSYENHQEVPISIDLQQETISSMIRAHYGYLEYPFNRKQQAMLLVLPIDGAAIRDKMMVKLPIDCLTSETPVTSKEQADSMMVLMQFHDYVCKFAHEVDPIDAKTISNLLLLLRQSFGFKRHFSGQLFYVRVVGIAKLVVEWVFHSPKVIYASLLYELVRHTCVPLSYIKDHYNLGVYAFVLNVLSVDKRKDLDHPSLFYVQNHLKEAIKKDHIQLSVLFIKLGERLYDLRHSEGYIMLEEVKYMAQETLIVDVKLANKYLGSEIAEALTTAAQQALKTYYRKTAR